MQMVLRWALRSFDRFLYSCAQFKIFLNGFVIIYIRNHSFMVLFSLKLCALKMFYWWLAECLFNITYSNWTGMWVAFGIVWIVCGARMLFNLCKRHMHPPIIGYVGFVVVRKIFTYDLMFVPMFAVKTKNDCGMKYSILLYENVVRSRDCFIRVL